MMLNVIERFNEPEELSIWIVLYSWNQDLRDQRLSNLGHEQNLHKQASILSIIRFDYRRRSLMLLHNNIEYHWKCRRLFIQRPTFCKFIKAIYVHRYSWQQINLPYYDYEVNYTALW